MRPPTFDSFAKHFLPRQLKPDGVAEESWSFHPLVGVLRTLWKTASAPSAVPTSPSLALATPSLSGGLTGALVGQGRTITVADRDAMRRSLENKCTGTLVRLATLPSISLLQRVEAQQDSKAWDWICWKRLLSEKAVTAMKGRRKTDPHEAFMEAAPRKVQLLLQVRARAYFSGLCEKPLKS